MVYSLKRKHVQYVLFHSHLAALYSVVSFDGYVIFVTLFLVRNFASFHIMCIFCFAFIFEHMFTFVIINAKVHDNKKRKLDQYHSEKYTRYQSTFFRGNMLASIIVRLSYESDKIERDKYTRCVIKSTNLLCCHTIWGIVSL